MKIQDGFTVDAPAAAVWALLSDPEGVATLLPGAKMGEQLDDNTYSGGMSMKVGPLAVAYKGTVSFQLDEDDRSCVVHARGQGKAGMGTAAMSMTSRVVALDDARTEVTIDSDVVVSGILAQMGRGMIQVVSKKMLQEFVGNLTQALAEQAKES